MAYEKIEYELAGDVAVLRMNDPATLNAMSAQMGEELRDGLRRAQRDARAIVIGGVGRAFCSGANLSQSGLDTRDPERDAGAGLEATFNPLILDMRNAAVPVITAVRGAAAGVGCGIALAGDMIVASESAYFYQAFCKIGLVPDGGSSYLLAKAIGRVRAMEMMMLGTKLPAPRALDWGLINRVVPDDDVDRAALALARELAAGPRALGMLKAVAWAALDAPLDDQLATERHWQRLASRTDDFVEGVTAFQQKRPAVFRGE